MSSGKNMPEEFLQYIWGNRLFKTDGLLTHHGEQLEILDTGKHNTNSGPDFFNARVKIGDTTWAGNIEIHQKTSDWQKHKHQADKAYDNVILHVSEEMDARTFRTNGEEIPVLLLQYPKHLAQNYQQLLEANTWIPCEKIFHKIDPIVLQLGFNRLMIERLESKTGEIESRLQQNNNDWNETFYQMLARMFGFKINAIPFELLAQSLPSGILAKHSNSLFQLEALLFGNAGLLNSELLGDDYFLQLREEYSFLYKKYKLKGIESHLWKFMRLRPVNFPTIRISQLAALLYGTKALFSKIIETDNVESLISLFKVRASKYWNNHYKFNKASTKNSSKELGESSARILIINVVIPFLFVYGEKQNKEELKNRALDFLEKIPAENNTILRRWEELGIHARSAFESQALLQLKKHYCETKKCLNCHIGVKLVTSPE